MAVWVLWVVLERQHSSVMISVKKEKRERKRKRTFNKDLFYSNACGTFSDTENGTQALMQRPLGGDIYAGSRKVSNTEVQPS